MIILGADLSYTRSGLVWLDTASNKVVHHASFAVTPGPRRMIRAAGLFKAYFDGHINVKRPSLVVIEDAAYGSPSRITLCKLVELVAVFKLVLEAYPIDYLLVSPTLIKKWITGSGLAEKHIVARELKRKYGIHFKDDVGNDLSDAAALACWGANR